ncbi:hypothetical protein RFI_13683 [Reticulomyxa filosa]|uniref:Uncharacterized protein n=1 Tax=Reticulomyxa filosa TaxID=46433 RepID=X6NDS8_RETFI|nr:hypothetical protein RFI_13683 [Reticulomyxa filosa]|eukprot:ETO23497.1 hypothetical protein RFI_13683 [Reticulomyxa filosa]
MVLMVCIQHYPPPFFFVPFAKVYVGQIHCCDGRHNLPAKKSSNTTFSLLALAVPESVYSVILDEEIPTHPHLIDFGLRGYGYTAVKTLGIEAYVYTDCWFSLNGSVFVENDIYVKNDSHHHAIEKLLNQTWKLDVVNQTCQYSGSDFKFFQF